MAVTSLLQGMRVVAKTYGYGKKESAGKVPESRADAVSPRLLGDVERLVGGTNHLLRIGAAAVLRRDADAHRDGDPDAVPLGAFALGPLAADAAPDREGGIGDRLADGLQVGQRLLYLLAGEDDREFLAPVAAGAPPSLPLCPLR